MNRALASVGIAAAVICGSAAPALAADTPKTSETKLAKTGTYAGALAVLVPLIAAVGTIAYITSRKEDN